MKRLSFGGLGLFAAFAAAAILLWVAGFVVAEDPIFGERGARAVFDIAAVAASIAVMLLAGRLIVGSLFGGAPTGFQQAIIYSILTFITSALLLAHYNFDLRAILTTSAVVTAVVGLAMQPTVGSVISGLTVYISEVVRVGDGIVHKDEIARIVALNWRSVVARRNSGALVVIPNSKVADEIAEIVRHDRSLRVNSRFSAPVAVPPEWIAGLVTQMVSDFAAVDPTRPVEVAPFAFDPQSSAVTYNIAYNIDRFEQQSSLHGEVLRRLWELGFSDYEEAVWLGVVAPAKTPHDVIARLSSWFTEAIEAPDVKPKLRALGLETVGQCGAAFADHIHRQFVEYGRRIREANITSE
jgi:small-conductance mechanosensitive channel